MKNRKRKQKLRKPLHPQELVAYFTEAPCWTTHLAKQPKKIIPPPPK